MCKDERYPLLSVFVRIFVNPKLCGWYLPKLDEAWKTAHLDCKSTVMARNGYKKISSDDDVEKVSFVSLLLFQWMNSVFKIGNKRALEECDFLPLSKENTTRSLTEQLQTNWNREKANCKENGKKPKLWKSVTKMLSVEDAMIFIFLSILYSFSRLTQPLFLGYFVSTLMSAEPQRNPLLYSCALAMCINALIGALAVHHLCYTGELVAIRMSSALKGLVYHKTLFLSKHALLKFTTGHVIDLISNDVQRLEGEAAKFLFSALFPILDSVVASVLLVYLIGWQTLMGVIFLCLLVPYFAGLSYVSAVLRLRTAVVSDRRIALMNQVVSGIRAIKTHAWEDFYRKQIKHARRHEVNIIRKKSAALSGVSALEFTSLPMATLVSVITLVLTGQPLTPVNAFMLLSYITVLRESTCFHLAYGLLENYEAYVSLGRIEEFLLLKNLPAISCDHTAEDTSNLDSISTELIGSRCLTVITGPVGSGKSTLLSAIAGEVSDISGTITCQGTLVYVPQTAWIFTGTIRENILFGQPYDKSKYTKIIEACALTEDIQQFPNFDQTVVGERGEVLSGGQQARVSLARAVYVDADLYLLDNPLSAVDFTVGQHVFEKCIKGLLGNKTRVLTSHQGQHMKEADEVIVLCKGRVLAKGSFTKLQEEGILNIVDPHNKSAPEDSKPDNSVVWAKEHHGEDADRGKKVVRLPREAKGLEISQEDRTIGVVSFKLYWNYFRSGANSLVISAVICLCLFTQAIIIAPDVWLSFLTKQIPEDQKDKTNLGFYGCLVIASIIFSIIRAYGFLLVSLRCSERLHDKMVVAILQAPVLFFDSNPLGRILNRFSKDIGCLDELLPKTFLMAIQFVLILLMSILVPTVSNPWLLFFIVPLTVLVVYISKYYLNTSRELKRLESICRSPVFSHISETLNGLDTIRTRGRQRDFVDQFYRYQDVHSQSFIMVMASGRWLGVRLDLLSSLLIGAVALAAVLASQDAAYVRTRDTLTFMTIAPFVITLSSACKRTSGMTQYAVRKTSDVENFMTSVERVMTYTKLDSEPGYKVQRRPPEHWPREGTITLQDVSLTYYPGGPQVLKKISLKIKGGAKIGVAGRTGAGKSSFVAALMRMPDVNGMIMVDDIPIKEINLQEARRCISVLGQSPVLFSGSLRKNLDLVEHFQDADLWQALEDVQLKEWVESLDGKLNHELLEHGANVSVGERQLICLARVLLQQSKIIILDEPTAHVDPDTEQTIWNVVREKLRDSTVITIAHRLNTIKECDMILVLQNGEVNDFDRFDLLVNREGSALREMARGGDI
ncbi:hypothetical protein ACROYT_G037960 [Oculina patagonica]